MSPDSRLLTWCIRPLRAAAGWLRSPAVSTDSGMMVYTGGCHCRHVRFEVHAPQRLTLLECNCSICSMAGYLHLVVPIGAFTLVSGKDALTTYQFQTKTAEHTFCSTCGIKSFYVPRADPFSRSVNARCLDAGPGPNPIVVPFDGRRWAEPSIRI